ncbi:hypothetical protein DAPPUDRAFT_319678 [Daphnia pulex]|uniref:Uncharacterized protein n=1 Tax=Daphnia pulex TaxID=6669 RepID=E9GMG9_DAPPU|nr:hypothetical protein DAPPUDRAFT_319678 [Daphnia pulex]|eukprot:EFX79392.1 hypothetical protein DAPPUDRAFT_319678 [Daphnia pulex]
MCAGLQEILLRGTGHFRFRGRELRFHYTLGCRYSLSEEVQFQKLSSRYSVRVNGVEAHVAYLAVPKSSPYKEEINRASLWFFDTGLREYWLKAYEKPPEQCRLDYNSKRRCGQEI